MIEKTADTNQEYGAVLDERTATPLMGVELSQNSHGSFQISCSVKGFDREEMKQCLDKLLKDAKDVVLDNGFVLAH